MTEITQDIYSVLAERLLEKIGRANFFNGSVAAETEDGEFRLTATLIVYRENERAPDGDGETISGIVPVWWELSSRSEEGETRNDFSWNEIIKYLMP